MINELELKLQNETGVYERAHTKYPEYFDAGGYSFNDGHLGGTNVVGCPGTYYHPNLWKFIFEKFNIETMVDVGCGFGFAIKFIKDNFPNIVVSGIEGSAKVVELSLYPELITQHDYSTGPLDIKTTDFGWSTEFVEHVEEKYVSNFMKTFENCKYVGISFAQPGQAGHHHVNCNTAEYWIKVFSDYNFEFLEDINKELKNQAYLDSLEVKDKYKQNYLFAFYESGLFFKNKNLIK